MTTLSHLPCFAVLVAGFGWALTASTYAWLSISNSAVSQKGTVVAFVSKPRESGQNGTIRVNTSDDPVRDLPGRTTQPRNDLNYVPVVRFQIENEQTFEFVPSTTRKPVGYQLNQQVELLHDSLDPKKAALQRNPPDFVGQVVFGIFFVTFLWMLIRRYGEWQRFATHHREQQDALA